MKTELETLRRSDAAGCIDEAIYELAQDIERATEQQIENMIFDGTLSVPKTDRELMA